MRRFIAAVLSVLAVAAAPATAQDAMTLTVRPSGFDDLSPAARARAERLQRRLREADFLFRHICVGCGGIEGPGANAPFDPIGALDRPRR
jgi:hypothetical protein